MRAALAILLMIGSGCVTTTEVTRRVAFATLPTAPLGLSGGSGVRLNVTAPTADPTAAGPGGSGMAFPMFQPDLGVTLKIGPRSYVGGKLAIASASFGARGPAGTLTAPSQAGAFDLGVGGGHDLPFSPGFGLSLSGELGVAGVSLTTTGSFSETHPELLPSGRLALGLYGTIGPLRIYGGGTVAMSAKNDAFGTRTVDCTRGCAVTETGQLSLSAVGMLGAGLRWQPTPMASLALEGWVPLSEDGTRLPFMLSLSLTLGDFRILRDPKAAPLPPPPPAPKPEPVPLPVLDPEQAPVQL